MSVDIYSTSKRLPIVFCLDVSPSMGWHAPGCSSSMDLLNSAVDNFIKDLKIDPKTRCAAEIAFVTFSTNIEMNTDFESCNTIRAPRFAAVEKGGTQMAQAVLESIAKIEAHRKELEDSQISYYAPFLVLVTDGNPDKNDNTVLQQKAFDAVKSHCNSHIGASEIIVPFIIGVGDYVDPVTLKKYSEGFVDGYFHINGDAALVRSKFNKVFELIGNSTKKSVHLNARGKEIIDTVRNEMEQFLTELAVM